MIKWASSENVSRLYSKNMIYIKYIKTAFRVQHIITIRTAQGIGADHIKIRHRYINEDSSIASSVKVVRFYVY